jgi:hypothetical protein
MADGFGSAQRARRIARQDTGEGMISIALLVLTRLAAELCEGWAVLRELLFYPW